MNINPHCGDLRVQRVDNGWVVFSERPYDRREGGYLPEGTHVAITAFDLAKLVQVWALAQVEQSREASA